MKITWPHQDVLEAPHLTSGKMLLNTASAALSEFTACAGRSRAGKQRLLSQSLPEWWKESFPQMVWLSGGRTEQRGLPKVVYSRQVICLALNSQLYWIARDLLQHHHQTSCLRKHQHGTGCTLQEGPAQNWKACWWCSKSNTFQHPLLGAGKESLYVY